MKIFVPENISEAFISEIKRADSNAEVIYLPPSTNIDGSVAFHTDIAITKIDGTIVASPQMFPLLKNKADNVICGNTTPHSPYPDDVAYCGVQVGKFYICSEKHTDDVVLQTAEAHGLHILNVRQGYAKCSIAVAGHNAIITADKGIADIATKSGIDALKIENDGVLLEGFSNGFIGGASCYIENKNTLIFTGDIDRYSPYAADIRNFCASAGTWVISIKNEPLKDFGSPLCLT